MATFDFLEYKLFVEFEVAKDNNYSSNTKAVIVEKNGIQKNDFKSFNIFRMAAEECLEYKNVDKENYSQDIIAMWDMVHGLATMIATNTFNYDMLNTCKSLNMYTIKSTNISNDPYIFVKENLKSGSIFDMKNNKKNVESLNIILKYIKQKGLNIVTLDELLNEDITY